MRRQGKHKCTHPDSDNYLMCSSNSSVIEEEEEETGDHCDLLCGITSSVEVVCLVNFAIDPTHSGFIFEIYDKMIKLVKKEEDEQC